MPCIAFGFWGTNLGDLLIFDDGKDGQFTNYSDLLFLQDETAYRKAHEIAKDLSHDEKLYWTKFLEVYYQASVQLHKIWISRNTEDLPTRQFNYDIDYQVTGEN